MLLILNLSSYKGDVKLKYQPKHLKEDQADPHKKDKTAKGANIAGVPSEETEMPATAHPLGIPIPDPGDGGEYVPIPGKGSIEQIAPNGAVIRNPWSEQPEIKPDYAYTDEQEDQNLLIM